MIDKSKLKCVQNKPDGALVAQCPACAAKGQDSKGEHLYVYADGKFGCVVHPKDKTHNREILELAGCESPAVPVRRRMTLTIRPYHYSKPATISIIPRRSLNDFMKLANGNEASIDS